MLDKTRELINKRPAAIFAHQVNGATGISDVKNITDQTIASKRGYYGSIKFFHHKHDGECEAVYRRSS